MPPPPNPNSARASNPIHHERHIRIIAVGAGASGLVLAYKLQRSFRNYSLTIYEKNADVAGTWHENRYPGCACDVPAHAYSYSFWPYQKPDVAPTHVYASSAQIKAYFKGFADAFGLEKYVRLRTAVVGARWVDDGKEEGRKVGWEVEWRNEATGETGMDECDVLVDATGFLNEWEWPKVQGLEKFEGRLIHTADWPEDFDFRGKDVGLIGNGSSAIQVLPAIQPHVKSLTTFIRSPTYIAPPMGTSDQREYTEEEKQTFKNQPGALLKHRKEMEDGLNKYFAVFKKGSAEQATFHAAITGLMRTRLASRPDLISALIPSWSAGCRRFTPGPGYLEALQAPNVHAILPPTPSNPTRSGDVVSITATHVTTADGAQHGPFDALICATGFNTSFRPRYSVLNTVTNRNLQDEWGVNDDARGYMAVAAAGFPNYLSVFGPSSPTGNGAILSALEAQVDYILAFLDRFQTENIRSFAPKQQAVDDFNDHVDAFMARMVWSEDCRSWYKNHSVSGRVTGLWPGSMLHFREAIKEPRWDDWEIVYDGNRFAWLGNGFSQTEVDREGDVSWYISEKDDSEFASRRSRRQALTGKKKVPEPVKAKL
ncbi:putative sterigmatocystin biosynthesis monooxygenase stcW [Lasiodiplodia hormozganensis]|uniref:Sterigmatocystin biosynthesis monooxygenase stcW n=1 Tax=Lasiodiplodia hormozganensis TaxID=869390 RepID=A0AA39Z061_9PEZI|nr:putative sterigmatocystin biosynthesis monooxygenase stcW [Lasiodiplodia hormozganensis]